MSFGRFEPTGINIDSRQFAEMKTTFATFANFLIAGSLTLNDWLAHELQQQKLETFYNDRNKS